MCCYSMELIQRKISGCCAAMRLRGCVRCWKGRADLSGATFSLPVLLTTSGMKGPATAPKGSGDILSRWFVLGIVNFLLKLTYALQWSSVTSASLLSQGPMHITVEREMKFPSLLWLGGSGNLHGSFSLSFTATWKENRKKFLSIHLRGSTQLWVPLYHRVLRTWSSWF